MLLWLAPPPTLVVRAGNSPEKRIKSSLDPSALFHFSSSVRPQKNTDCTEEGQLRLLITSDGQLDRNTLKYSFDKVVISGTGSIRGDTFLADLFYYDVC